MKWNAAMSTIPSICSAHIDMHWIDCKLLKKSSTSTNRFFFLFVFFTKSVLSADAATNSSNNWVRETVKNGWFDNCEQMHSHFEFVYFVFVCTWFLFSFEFISVCPLAVTAHCTRTIKPKWKQNRQWNGKSTRVRTFPNTRRAETKMLRRKCH